MKTKPRYLSKSRFKTATSCPSKLFYTGKHTYEDQSNADSFLEALAEGGYQVGELAKCYYPGGIEIESLYYDEALEQTQTLLNQENVIIYEPAFLFNNLFVRVDILVKKGHRVQLIEVKAKSYTSVDDFTHANGIAGEWQPYLIDVAFQKHVVARAHPEWEVSGYLMLADKSQKATVDGLNQAFPVSIKPSGRLTVEHQPLADYGQAILRAESVDAEIEQLWQDEYTLNDQIMDFETYVNTLSEAYQKDIFLQDGVGAKCKGCEFHTAQPTADQRSGFYECWQKMRNIDLSQHQTPLLFELTNGRIKKYFDRGFLFLKDLPEDEFDGTIHGELSQKNRRYLHIVKTKTEDQSLYFAKERFAELKAKLTYPLHMIDFETTRVAIPFHAGMHPYEQIAFQFSHHTISESGKIEHAHQWISTEKGAFPNFEFVRQLKKALSQDEGSIFRYSHHENSVLRAIYAQLYASKETDKEELMTFIDGITHHQGLAGHRNMFDLCRWVKETYFDVATKGSSSLKVILPSILRQSKYLQEKYSQPIYGNDIPSLSLGKMTLIKKDATGQIINPYQLLPYVFDQSEDEVWSNIETLAEGGTAMTAFAKIQFEEMPEAERQQITSALLRYCELDTMAMVLLWEGLNDLTG